jgi:hypothetical protein
MLQQVKTVGLYFIWQIWFTTCCHYPEAPVDWGCHISTKSKTTREKRLSDKIMILSVFTCIGKAFPLQAWTGPEGSRRLRLPYLKTIGHECGRVVNPTRRPPLHRGNIPGTNFCQRLSQPYGHSADGRIMLLKNSNETIINRTRDLPAGSAVPQPITPSRAPFLHVHQSNDTTSYPRRM